jgi:hypothetical protein
VNYESTLYAEVTTAYSHGGAASEVPVGERRWSRLVRVIPDHAAPGTFYKSKVEEAWFDCLHLPFGLSKIPRGYSEVWLYVKPLEE